MIFGTAGHIDHGKTALVRALTGIDADRLPEEKARGITIDLGYAYFDTGNGEVMGFVDAPGHERFVRNMVAGVTGIDFVLLVVAADDGPMPQTREHLDILHLLGVSRGAVALTKIDRVSQGRLAHLNGEIDALLAGTALAGCRRFPVSNVTGQGIDALKQHLMQAMHAPQQQESLAHFRMAIDRSFSLAGAGTVVTGTIHAGEVKIGDHLRVSPAGIDVRVRAIHAQNRPAETAHAGQRCALNIAGAGKREIHRGDWIVDPKIDVATRRIDVRLRLLGTESRQLKQATSVHVHLATADVTGQVILLEGNSLQPGDACRAQLVLDKPIGALRGDRFIIRDQSARRTVGGGKVLDPFAPARRRRTPERMAVLTALDCDSPRQSFRQLLERSTAGFDLDWFLRCWNRREPDVVNVDETRIVDTGAGRFAVLPEHWKCLRDGIVGALGEAHDRSPDVLGLNGQQLRKCAAPLLPWQLFTQVINELMRDRVVSRQGAWFHLPAHRIQLSAHEKAQWQRVERLLATEPFQPPRVRDIARALNDEEARVRSLLQRTTLAGETVFVAHDHYFLRDAVVQLARIAHQLMTTNGAVRAAEFRDRIGTGRKLAIRILECFDHIGFLKRIGDDHFVRNPLVLLDVSAPVKVAEKSTGRDSHPGGATGLQIR